jgi:hypothetical protein
MGFPENISRIGTSSRLGEGGDILTLPEIPVCSPAHLIPEMISGVGRDCRRDYHSKPEISS